MKRFYTKPKEYALYELRKIEGNRYLKGSSHAEQNHASSVAHLGKGAMWEIAEHITNLLEREGFL